MGDDVHARRVEPEEERLAVRLGLVHELEGQIADLVVHRLHPLRIERAGVLDLLLADLAPARHHRRVVRVRRPAVDHVARADLVQQLLRVGGMRRVLHRVEVIEVAEELVEAVDGGQELVEVAEVVLAELARGIAHGLERRGDGHRLRGDADGRAGLADRGHAGADRQLAGDEVRAARRAARLGVVVGEQHAFGGELVEVRRPPGHHAAVVGADVPHADVVAHDDDDVGRGCGAGSRHADPHTQSEATRRPPDDGSLPDPCLLGHETLPGVDRRARRANRNRARSGPHPTRTAFGAREIPTVRITVAGSEGLSTHIGRRAGSSGRNAGVTPAAIPPSLRAVRRLPPRPRSVHSGGRTARRRT